MAFIHHFHMVLRHMNAKLIDIECFKNIILTDKTSCDIVCYNFREHVIEQYLYNMFGEMYKLIDKNNLWEHDYQKCKKSLANATKYYHEQVLTKILRIFTTNYNIKTIHDIKIFSRPLMKLEYGLVDYRYDCIWYTFMTLLEPKQKDKYDDDDIDRMYTMVIFMDDCEIVVESAYTSGLITDKTKYYTVSNKFGYPMRLFSLAYMDYAYDSIILNGPSDLLNRNQYKLTIINTFLGHYRQRFGQSNFPIHQL